MLGETFPVAGLRGTQPQHKLPAAITDIGCERDINEDRYAVIDSPVGKAWVVCDGMGGTLGGELAAQLAIDAVRRGLESRANFEPQEAFLQAIEEANRVIVLRRQNPQFSGMGTTIVGALINGNEVFIAHAGDSRAYLVRDSAIQQLTIDHTYVQDLVDRGAISEEEALSHPQAHVLTRCLGAEPRLKVDGQKFWIWDIESNDAEDRLVLCSDGLYSLVGDDEIAERVSKGSPQESCVDLVELAKERGGYDNITLAILPLGGQLREESPGRTSRIRTPGKAKELPPEAKIPWGKRLVIFVLLLMLGFLGMALGLMVQMLNG